jgi:DNA polymerase (family 10)
MAVNQELARRFEEIAQMLDLLGEDSFRASAHARAARNIAELPFDLEPIACEPKKLQEIEGIGAGMAKKIAEFCATGKIADHEALKEKVPPGLLGLLRIQGLGAKTVRSLWTSAGITDLEGLKAAIISGSILEVPRMGAKAVEKIKAAIEQAQQGEQRLPLGRAMPLAETVVATLVEIPGVEEAAYAGSLRRGRDTVGDLDFLVSTSDPARVSEAFRTMPQVTSVLAAGDTKSSVRLAIKGLASGRAGGEHVASIQADLRVVPRECWGAALMYFTGSKDHNVRLRERAQKQGLTLNEYGLFPEDGAKTPPQSRGVKPVACASEEEIYARLGLPFLPPEIREDRGELSLKETPRLVEIVDIKAELHAHTTASDGAYSIDELAARAKAHGFHTIAVTDHSRSSAFAGGLTVERLLEHIEDVRKANERAKGVTILAGSEVDILADGRLDYPDEVLGQLDIVVASPHAALTQDPEAATKRLIAAVSNPYVHILGHPTGRLVNRRAGTSPDISRVVGAAREHNVALEINAHWHRLDLRDTHVRAAIDAGCLIAINCDTHSEDDLDNLRYGIFTGRRGWVTPERCLNAWPAKRLHEWLKSKR